MKILFQSVNVAPLCRVRHARHLFQLSVFCLAVGMGGTSHAAPITGWEFYQGDLGGAWEALRVTNSSKLPTWTPVELPHCFNQTDAVDPDRAYYQGPGWYRAKLRIDNPYPAGRTCLRFDGAGQKTRVYVGSVLVGEHTGGYDEFSVDITDAIPEAGQDADEVTLLVRCDNSRDLEMIPSDLSDFNLYGGLYRSVHLRYRPAAYVEWPRIQTDVDAQGKMGAYAVRARVENPSGHAGELRLQLRILDPGGDVISEQETRARVSAGADVPGLSFEGAIETPQLWSPDHPALYRWELSSTIQGQTAPFAESGAMGFRHAEFQEKGPFFLNGRRLLLRGMHRHEDHAGLAAAMPDARIRQEMELMKSIGVNFIRLGHYQQSRKVLELCDELGILVWEEIPWCRGGLGGPVYQEQAKSMLRNMITQHQHHPSVILWGLGNENDWPGDFPEFEQKAIRAFMSELNHLAHELDPSRMTSIRRCAFCADIVDVYSPSIWAGWYRGKYTSYQEVSRREMEQVDRFIHVEWGASHHARRHSEDPDKGLASIRSGDADERAGDYLMSGGDPRVSKDGDWTETYACNLIDWHLKEQETMPWLTGTAYWPFKDFSTPIRPENPVPYVNQKGIVERDLTPKESFYVFQSYWSDRPMIHIYGHTWPIRWGGADEPKMVKIYSNCARVELLLNGESLGIRERDSQDFPAAGLRWVTTFREGKNTLEAVGWADGEAHKDRIEFVYQTQPWSRPSQLHFEVLTRGPEHAMVQVYALDEAGVRCLDANQVVRFEIAGDGELVADLGTSTASRKVQLYNGRAQITVLKKGGTSMVSVSSTGMETQFLKIGQGQVRMPGLE